MSYQLNLGSMRSPGAATSVKKSGRFRIAVLGDFSGRTNIGQLETGTELSSRKPMRVDCDNLDDQLKRLKVRLRLPVGPAGTIVEVPVNSLDDLHPDQLYKNLPIFSELAGLRQRLKTPSTFAKAAQEIQTWAGAESWMPVRTKSRSVVIPVDSKISDFARLIGEPTASTSASTISQLLKQVVGPYVVPAKDPRQDHLVATVDSGLAAAMRSVLHNPDFQAFEALWRSVDLMVRRLETDETLQIVLYDITAEEFAADLSRADSLENSGLYKLLVEQPALDAAQGAFSVVIGNYQFDQTPPHAELLGRAARVVAQTQTAFIASLATHCLDTKPTDLHPLIREAWDGLARLPESSYLGLALPRFMLRNPYGDNTDPIESFDFEEFNPQTGLSGMLWGNPAIIAGFLLGSAFLKQGAKMQLGEVLSVGDMPFYYYTDKDGDQTALPCTERMLTSKAAEAALSQRFMPLLSIKGQPQLRLGGFRSLAGGGLAGPWAPIAASKIEAAQPSEPRPRTAPPASGGRVSQPSASTEPPCQAEDKKVSGESAPKSESDLDALLASLNDETATAKPSEPAASNSAEVAPDEEPTIDPELAKLLAELG